MSVKDELHDLVERLDDDRTSDALSYLRELVEVHDATATGELSRLDSRLRAPVVESRDFFRQPRVDLATLAAQQGVIAVKDFDALLGDFWPEDESVDEFVDAVRVWRSEGNCA